MKISRSNIQHDLRWVFSLDKSWWTSVGEYIKTLIRTDAKSGTLQNPEGTTNHSYSTKMASKGGGKYRNITNGQRYLMRKRKLGQPVTPTVNMEATGGLLSDIGVNATKLGVTLTFDDPKAYEKVTYNKKSYGTTWDRIIDSINPENRSKITAMFNEELTRKIGKFNTSKITITINGKI